MDWIFVISAVAALGSVYYAYKAELRAARAEGSADAISRLQGIALNQQVVGQLKHELKPYYGSGQFITEAKRAMNSGIDPRIVVRAVELAVAEADERTDRRARRIIEYRAALLDLADELAKGVDSRKK